MFRSAQHDILSIYAILSNGYGYATASTERHATRTELFLLPLWCVLERLERFFNHSNATGFDIILLSHHITPMLPDLIYSAFHPGEVQIYLL
ncbi:MAG: hypothetical protein HC862_14320 [Scytonema sp. RU_4_4]|nr:hypothetical protein [Scytonema sp. RU_4_4]NJR73575.1 hypothetical protein [Scytonema sp. CRU_2_7]